MESSFELTVVAFVHATGGQVRVLLAIDRDGEPLFDGEPALLFEHRPGRASEHASLEGADRLDPGSVQAIFGQAHGALAKLVEAAFDETGMFDGQRMLGGAVRVLAPRDSFGE